MKVCVIGSGYVGLVTGICFAANDKHDVVFFDTNSKKIEDLMKRFLLTPIFKTFKRRTFFSSLEQNNCPVYDAEEIKKQEQKEAIERLYP